MHADTAVELNPVIIVTKHSCDNGQWRVRYGSFIRIFMAKVTSSHEIECEIRYTIDLGSFLISWVRAGQEIESETGYTIDLGSFLISWVTAGQEIESEIQKCNNEKRRRKKKKKKCNPTSISIS